MALPSPFSTHHLFHLLLQLLLHTTRTTAHFKLQSPPARGFNEDSLGQYPCGGFNQASTARTPFPLAGAPVQLYLEHANTNINVLLALGNSPGPDDFVYVVVPTFQEAAPLEFCMREVNVRSALGGAARDGVNATLLVTTNGDTGPGSGLYNCADITLSKATKPQGFSARCADTSSQVAIKRGDPKINPNDTKVPSGVPIGDALSPIMGGGGDDGGDAGTMVRADLSAAVLAFAGVILFVTVL